MRKNNNNSTLINGQVPFSATRKVKTLRRTVITMSIYLGKEDIRVRWKRKARK